MSIEFSDEIGRLEATLEEKQAHLAKLKSKRDAHGIQTRRARQAVGDLRAVLRGEEPPSEKEKSRSSVAGIAPLEVNDDTDRPRRGARRDQIASICRKVGASGDIFRTRDVLNVLREVEDEVKDGLRSYTYTLMNSLEDDGLIERKGRGKWLLKK